MSESISGILKRKKKAVEDKFHLYPTAEACAEAAQPVFERNNWQWKYIGVPHEAQLLHGLIKLKQNAEDDNSDLAVSGRLIYYKGQFGFQKGKDA